MFAKACSLLGLFEVARVARVARAAIAARRGALVGLSLLLVSIGKELRSVVLEGLAGGLDALSVVGINGRADISDLALDAITVRLQ